MKKLMIAFAAMALITSCETKVSGDSSTNTTAVAEKNAESTNKVYRALETGDVSGLDSLFTEDVVDHDASMSGGDLKGRDSVKASIAAMHTFVEGLKIEMLHHATSPDGVYHYSTSRMTGTASATCPWMPPGTPVDETSVDVIKLKDGKCTDHWRFSSMKDVNEMMGAMMHGAGKPEEKK